MYKSLKGEAQTERTVERSRFLTYAAHTAGEGEAREFLARVRAAHPLATHVCWAFICDKIGNEQRFSDDGEPQGTAGMPILGVIKARNLFETTVAVVRYFGGIKLGAGGLTRAYAASASEGIAAAELCEYDVCTELSVIVNYPEADALIRFLGEVGASVLSREFGERAVFTVAVRERDSERFRSALLNRLNGKVDVRELKKYDYPFALGAGEER